MIIDRERSQKDIPSRERKGPQPSRPAVLDLFKGRRSAAFDSGTGFLGGPSRRKGYRLALWSWMASFIDLLILISLSTAFILAFSWVMRINTSVVLKDLIGNQNQVLIFLESFALCSWIYMVSVRSVLGSTIGEWACDLRLGQPQERLRSSYVFRVALRSTIILVTGMIPLPLLSLVLGKDVPGALSGLRLFSLK